MAARRTPAKAPGAPAAASNGYGEISDRLRDLFARTVSPGPYQVTDRIIIRPPTRGEWQKLDALQSKQWTDRLYLSLALQQTGDNALSIDELKELAEAVNGGELAYDKLLFGDQHDKVKAFSDGWLPENWQAFREDVKAHFLGRGPETGACPHCGEIIDADLALKGSKPST